MIQHHDNVLNKRLQAISRLGWRFIILLLITVLVIMLFSACGKKQQEINFKSIEVSHIINQMTEIMVHDITNPPLAARFFSYACLAGYEVVSQHDHKYKTMVGIVNEYPQIRRPDSIGKDHYQLTALLAMLETAKKMQPSGKLLEAYEKKLLDSCLETGMDETLVDNSKQYAIYIAKQVLAYAKGDRYNKISNLPRYTPLVATGKWYPTPPGFMAAVEPYFNTMRPFLLDSAAQFKPGAPVEFDPAKGSPFYALSEAVYREGIELSGNHRIIAAFWDCNPFAMQDEGHLQYGFKKISPGAHWLGITGIALQSANKNFDYSMQVLSIVAMGLNDSFICCWDEKFRSNRIRPETAIRKLIDPAWTPLLQTPPFPEYLSGHSCVSATTATILTHYLGDNFAYTDSVEVNYGLPPRKFASFKRAAQEAAVSRFYGGIHFMDAIENGLVQGNKVGELILGKLK